MVNRFARARYTPTRLTVFARSAVRKTSILHAAGALALATLPVTLLVTWLPLADAQAAEIRIGFANGSSADYAPAFAAEKLGSFKQAGLDVRLIAFRGGAAAQEALTAGAADIIAYFGPAVALAVSKGVKEKMVATILAGHSGWNLIVPTDSPARSVKDLAGKKVGITTKASTSDMAALWIAEQAGIAMAQIPLGAGAIIPALRSHQVDAIVFSALLTMREMLAGRARSLMDVGATMPATMANVYVASEDMLVNRPQELRAALAVIYKTLTYMKANRAWSMSYLKDFAKSDSDELTAALYDGIFPEALPGRADRNGLDRGGPHPCGARLGSAGAGEGRRRYAPYQRVSSCGTVSLSPRRGSSAAAGFSSLRRSPSRGSLRAGCTGPIPSSSRRSRASSQRHGGSSARPIFAPTCASPCSHAPWLSRSWHRLRLHPGSCSARRPRGNGGPRRRLRCS